MQDPIELTIRITKKNEKNECSDTRKIAKYNRSVAETARSILIFQRGNTGKFIKDVKYLIKRQIQYHKKEDNKILNDL